MRKARSGCFRRERRLRADTGRMTPRRRRRFDSGLLVLPTDPIDARNRDRLGEPGPHSLVDSAVYVAGERVGAPTTLAETYTELSAHEGAVAWIGLYRPDA